MNIIEKVNNHIKTIANQVFDEREPEREEYVGNATLPEIDRNKYMALSVQRTHENLVPDVPAGAAMDGCADLKQFNSAYTITNPIHDIIYTHFATQGFIGFQACAILCQNWLINKACTLPSKDAIRPDYDLSYVTTDDTEEVDKDFLSKMKDESNDLKGYNIRKICRTFSDKKRQFGQVLLYPIVEGADYTVPFNLDSIQPNSYKGMAVVDPLWYEPILDDESAWNPASLRFNKPTYFSVKGANSLKLHHSWCVFGITAEVPDLLKPTYYWGGYPVPQLIYERVFAAEKTANEAPMLAMSKRLLVADINVKSYLTNQEAVTKELEALSRFRDNWGVAVKRPNETLSQIDTSLTDLDEVIMTQYQLVSAASCVPATKLLETQPKGFNSTGDYEDDQYKLLLTSIQEDDFVPILDFHYALLSKSKYGITRDYTINFKEIDVPTEKERAEINGIKAQTISTYLQAGIITEEEARNNLIKDPDSGFNDITDELPEGELFSDEEGEGSLGDLVNDPTITPSEAATLNGVQVTSMVNIASQVGKGELSRESGLAILEKSFNLSEAEANAIIGEEKLSEEPEGNGNTQQDPFSEDEEPEFRTTENGVVFPVDPDKGVTKSCKEHFKEKQKEQKYFEKWNNAPEIELKKSELDNYSNIKELRTAATKYFKENLKGKPITKEGLGDIRISDKGLDEYMHFSADPDKLKAVPQIPELIKKGKLGEFEKPHKPRKDNIIGFYPIYANLKTENGTKKAELLIAKDNEGNLFYQMFLDFNREEAQNKAQKKKDYSGAQDRLSFNNSITYINVFFKS